LDMLLPLFKVRNHTQFCADLGEQVTQLVDATPFTHLIGEHFP
jgi:hypothetical protein